MQDEHSSEEVEGYCPTEAEKDTIKRKRAVSDSQLPQDEDEEPNPRVRPTRSDPRSNQRPFQAPRVQALKGPHYVEDIDEEEDEAEGEEDRACEVDEPEAETDVPDLHQYFMGFDIDDAKVISMCRAYASYLVSLKPKTIKKEPISQKVAHWMAKKRRK